MSHFNKWVRRHLAADPQEPASPPKPRRFSVTEPNNVGHFEEYTEPTPVYDQMRDEALFADQVEADLKALTEGRAS